MSLSEARQALFQESARSRDSSFVLIEQKAFKSPPATQHIKQIC